MSTSCSPCGAAVGYTSGMITRFEHAYVLNVISNDHPGIVAAVSRAIAELRGNIDACSQTVLSGYFTLIMTVSLPEPVAPDELAGQVAGDAAGTGQDELQVVARPFVPQAPAGVAAPEQFVVTAYGTDKPGIIHAFSRYLADKDINITDLYWQVDEGQFVLISQVEIPAECDTRMLQADLTALGAAEGFTAHLQHENIFVATNQLRLTREMSAGSHGLPRP